MPRVRRSKRLRSELKIPVGTAAKTGRRSKNIGNQSHRSVPRVEVTSSNEGQDQKAVNQQIAKEQKLCAIEAQAETTVVPAPLDAANDTTGFADDETRSTESPNESRSPIPILHPSNTIAQPIDRIERKMVSYSPLLNEGGEDVPTKRAKKPPRRTLQTAKRSTGGRGPRYIYPGQKPWRKALD